MLAAALTDAAAARRGSACGTCLKDRTRVGLVARRSRAGQVPSTRANSVRRLCRAVLAKIDLK